MFFCQYIDLGRYGRLFTQKMVQLRRFWGLCSWKDTRLLFRYFVKFMMWFSWLDLIKNVHDCILFHRSASTLVLSLFYNSSHPNFVKKGFSTMVLAALIHENIHMKSSSYGGPTIFCFCCAYYVLTFEFAFDFR